MLAIQAMDIIPSIEEEDHSICQLEEELKDIDDLLRILNTDLNDKKQRKVHIFNEKCHLKARIDDKGATTVVQNFVTVLNILKALEREESDFQSHYTANASELQAEIIILEQRIESSNDSTNHNLHKSLLDSLEKVNSAKRELAARLREILMLKRLLDNTPSPSELIQYERRFSELYSHIQDKLRQTRKLYATYNALLEMKELMLKETSLLNSINSQFLGAIAHTAGRTKLVDSMEGIVKGTQQKLEKVRVALQSEQKVCDALKERYATSIAEQRRCYTLLEAFQVECARNDKLKSHASV